MHVAHLDRFGSVGRCAIFGFCISWPEMHIALLTDSVRLVDVRDSGLYVLARKSQDAYRTSRPIRLVDVRYSGLYFLAIKITRCISHISTSPRNPRFPIAHFDILTAFRARVSIFKSGISGSELDRFGSVGRCAIFTSGHGWIARPLTRLA